MPCRLPAIGLMIVLMTGCMAQRNSLVDLRATVEPSVAENAHKTVVMVLLDKGFDLKLNDKDLRVTTTEYKKYASVSGFPPFDFYMQVKAIVRTTPDGKSQITLLPKIKEQNRLNPNAFTEHSLIVYTAEEQKNDYMIQNGRGKAMLDGQMLFDSIVQTIAETLGLPKEEFKQTYERIEVYGM
jgi:hypothetical protein